MPPSSGSEPQRRRRPGIAQRQPPRRLVGGAGDAEDVAHDHRAPRHRGLVHRRHGAHAVADGRRPAPPPGRSGSRDNRPDAPPADERFRPDRRSARSSGRPPPSTRRRSDTGRRPATRPARPSNRAKPVMIERAEVPAHFEERALVDQRLDDLAHLVDLAPVARHRLHQLFVAARRDRPRRAASAAAPTPTTAGTTGTAARRRTPPPRCPPRGRWRRCGSGSPSRPVPSCPAFWPSRATTGGPATNIAEVLVITE